MLGDFQIISGNSTSVSVYQFILDTKEYRNHFPAPVPHATIIGRLAGIQYK
jgi:hypothetical protein